MAEQSNVPLRVCDEPCELTVITDIVLSESVNKVRKIFNDHDALTKSKKCPVCCSDMWLDEIHHQFGCKKCVISVDVHKKKVSKECDTCVSQYDGMWFVQGKLPIQKIFCVSLFWCLLKPPSRLKYSSIAELYAKKAQELPVHTDFAASSSSEQ